MFLAAVCAALRSIRRRLIHVYPRVAAFIDEPSGRLCVCIEASSCHPSPPPGLIFEPPQGSLWFHLVGSRGRLRNGSGQSSNPLRVVTRRLRDVIVVCARLGGIAFTRKAVRRLSLLRRGDGVDVGDSPRFQTGRRDPSPFDYMITCAPRRASMCVCFGLGASCTYTAYTICCALCYCSKQNGYNVTCATVSRSSASSSRAAVGCR